MGSIQRTCQEGRQECLIGQICENNKCVQSNATSNIGEQCVQHSDCVTNNCKKMDPRVSAKVGINLAPQVCVEGNSITRSTDFLKY